MRMKKTVTNYKMSWFLIKFSQLVTYMKYKKNSEENMVVNSGAHALVPQWSTIANEIW